MARQPLLKSWLGRGLVLAVGVAAVVVAIVLVRSSHGSLCGMHPLSSRDVPVPDGFRALSNVNKEPEGCGAPYRRWAVLISPGSLRGVALEHYAAALESDGWTPTRCVTARERCFRMRGLFIASTASKVEGYPRSRDPRALFVVVEPEQPDEHEVS